MGLSMSSASNFSLVPALPSPANQAPVNQDEPLPIATSTRPKLDRLKKRKAVLALDTTTARGKRKATDKPARGKKAKTENDALTMEALESVLELPIPPDPYAKKVTLGNGKKTVYADLQPGMLLFHPARLVIKGRSVPGDGVPHLTVENLDVHGPTREYTYRGESIIESQCINCDQYTEVKQETMSSLARILKEQVGDMLCKVEFTKEPVPADMAKLLAQGSELIEALFTDPAEKTKQYKRLYERMQQGEYRIMRGYILRDLDMSTQESETGMIKFLDADLMAQKQYAQRQINLRHLQALVLNGVRYERK